MISFQNTVFKNIGCWILLNVFLIVMNQRLLICFRVHEIYVQCGNVEFMFYILYVILFYRPTENCLYRGPLDLNLNAKNDLICRALTLGNLYSKTNYLLRL